MLDPSKPTNLDKLALITVGNIVDVEILTPTASKRIKTEFVGLLSDRFIILNFPTVKRLPNADEYLKDGVVVIVRAVLESGGGQVIAFRQQVMSVSSHPARLLYLHFPKQVQLFSLRSQTRIPTLIPAKMVVDSERQLEGVIKDISLTGVMFDTKTDDDLSELKATEIKLVLDKANKNISEFAGKVCSIKNKGSNTQLGIQLLASEGEIKTFMQNHLIDLTVLESLE